MSNTLLVGRTFQLWEYHVSHGSLLIRSPKSPSIATNVDIIFVGVEYFAAPRYLSDLQIMEPTASELRELEGILDKPLKPSSVQILAASGKRFPVVSVAFKVDENERDIFDNPFNSPRPMP